MPRRIARAWANLPNPPYIEVFSGATAVAWGVSLLANPEVLTTARLYEALERAFPWPRALACGAILVGLFQIAMFWRKGKAGRWFGAFAAGSFYFLLLTSIQRIDSTMPGLVNYMSFAGMNLLTMALLFRRRDLT